MSHKRGTRRVPDNDPLNRAHQAITARMRKALPELTECLTWLSRELSFGNEWSALLDTFARQLDHRRAKQLTIEIRDVLDMGIEPFQDLDAVVVVLGWDASHRVGEVPDAQSMLLQLLDVTVAVWEEAQP